MIKITKNLAAKLFFILCFIFTTKGTAATIYFNQIYKATGNTYGVESNSLANLQLVSGYSFKIISEIPGATSFSGNNIRVILNYVNSSGNEVTMYGIISRRIKSGSTTLGVNFVVTDSTWITPTGEAYFLVVPGNEASFSNGSNAGTSSDPIDTTLNNLLSFQATAPIINSSVSSVSVLENAGYAVFTFSLSNPATSNYSFTPYLTAVTATSGTDYTNTIEYYNGSTWAPASGGATFTPSNTSFQLRVPIINYNTSLTDKTFNINTGVITGGGILNNYGSYGVGTILVPVITTSGSLTSFSTCTGIVSSQQSFTVSGVNLVANLVVTPPAGYEVSTTSGSGFSSSVSLTPASNSVATTTIYVRLSTTAANNASGNIVCSSTSAVSKNVATVASSVSPSSVGGSISGATSVCSGTNSTTLTLNGSTGTVTKWQSSTSSDFSTSITDIANTTTSLVASNLTATTYYRAMVKSGSCASATSAAVTMTVNPASVAGTITGATSVCTGTNSTDLTLSGNTGDVTKWQYSSDDFVSDTNDVANTTTTLTAENLTATTYYRVVVSSGSCAAATSAAVTMTVNPASVAGTITGATSVCTGTNSTDLTLSGNTGDVTKWQYSSDDFVSDTNDVANTTTTLTAENLTATTYYRAVVTSGSCAAATSAAVTMTVNPASVAGTIAGATSVCTGTNSTDLTLSGNTGDVTKWQYSSDDFVSDTNDVANTTTTLTAENLTATTYYRVVVSSGSCAAATSAAVTMTVNPASVAGTITGATSVCTGINSTDLTLSGNTGDVTKWQYSSDDFVSDTNDVANTTTTLTAENLTATTYYRAVVTSGSCAAENTPSVIITVINTNIWNGSVSNDWNTADNWNCGVPASGANIEIPGGLSNYPELDSSRTIGNIILASGATLNLNNYNLNVSGTFSGTGTLIGSNTSSLTINGSGNQGTFYMDQTTPGTTNVLANFTLNSTTSGSITLGNALDILGILTLTNGTFNTGNNLTLKSDSTGTAVVAPITDCLNVAITGDVTVERFFPAKRAFRFISSPVTTTTTIRENWQEGVNNSPPAYSENLNPKPGYGTHITGNIIGTNGFDATQTTNNSMFTFNNTTGAWAVVTNTNALTLTAGVPYRLLIRGDRSINMNTNNPDPIDTTLRAKGELKICEAPAVTLNQNANGFSFIGNPYQATVDIKEVLDSSTNLSPNYYWVWDPKVNTRGSYVAYDLTSRLNPVSGSLVNEFLQPWKACFVKTSSAGAASITFHESNKSITTVNENVYKTTQTNSASYIRLTLYESNTLAAKGAAADGLIVKFGANYDNAIDGNDASKFTNQDENFATKNNTTLLGIESRLFPTASDVVPLNITQYRSSKYTIVANGTNMSGLTTYLQDQLLQTYTEIPQSGSVNYSYVLNSNDATTSNPDRFRIVVQNSSLNLESNTALVFSMYPNPAKQGVFDVIMNDTTADTKLQIYNSLGQEVYATFLTQSNINHVNPKKVFPAGVYYVNIKKDATTTVKKLIIE